MSSQRATADMPAPAPVMAAERLSSPAISYAVPPAMRSLDLGAAVRRIGARPGDGSLPVGAGIYDSMTALAAATSKALLGGGSRLMGYAMAQKTRADLVEGAAAVEQKVATIMGDVVDGLRGQLAANPGLELTDGQLDAIIDTVRERLAENKESVLRYVNWAFRGITETIHGRMTGAVGQANDAILSAYAAGLADAAVMLALVAGTAAVSYGGYKLYERYQAGRAAAVEPAADAAEAGPADQ